MSEKRTITAALKYARTRVTPLYGQGRGQHAFNKWSDKNQGWWQGHGMPYAAALLARRDALVCEALVYLGYDEADVYGYGYGEEGSARDLVSRYIEKDKSDV